MSQTPDRKAPVLERDEGKPRGYVYPRPSIDRGQSAPERTTPPPPFSRENVEKLKQFIRDLPAGKTSGG